MYHYSENEPTEKDSFLEQRSKIQCLDLKPSLDSIPKSFNYNTRSEIREAEKEGFEVKLNKNYDDFVSLFESQAKYKGLKMRKLPIIQIKQQKHLLVSIWNGKSYPLACDYAGIQDESLYMIFICNARCFNENPRLVSRASRLAHWEAVKWAKSEGYGKISVGALSNDPKDRGNVEFKKGFGGYEKEIKTYIKIYNPILKLLNMALKIL